MISDESYEENGNRIQKLVFDDNKIVTLTWNAVIDYLHEASYDLDGDGTIDQLKVYDGSGYQKM